MIIDNKNLVILIEVQKTGTTFIRRSLGYYTGTYNKDGLYISSALHKRHLTLSNIFKDPKLEHNPEDYDVHMFIRHPEDFLVSEFFEFKNNHAIPCVNKTKMFKKNTKAIQAHANYVMKRYNYLQEDGVLDLNKNLSALLSDENFNINPKNIIKSGSIRKHYVDIDIAEEKLHIHKYENFQDSIASFFEAIDRKVPDTDIRHNVNVKDQKINRQNRCLINEIFDYDFKTYGYYKRNKYSAI